jgi:hypothetical protein
MSTEVKIPVCGSDIEVMKYSIYDAHRSEDPPNCGYKIEVMKYPIYDAHLSEDPHLWLQD